MESAVFHFEVRPGEVRAVDPYRVKRLLARECRPDSLWSLYEQARGPIDPETKKPIPGGNQTELADAAIERLLAAACVAFGLTAIQPDGTGCTEATQWRILREFLLWDDAVKKNAAASQTSSPPMAPESLPSSAAPFHPSNDMDFGCTDCE